MKTYTVNTNLNPDQLTVLAVETFRQWLAFALGQSAIGGWVLENPTGRYAASLSWKRTGEASVAIIADEDAAPEGLWIEEGHVATSLKDSMLGGPGTKTSKDGYRYRDIALKGPTRSLGFDFNSLTSSGSGGGVPPGAKSMWAKQANMGHDRMARMSDKPGSADWIIPAFVPYAPAAHLADLIKKGKLAANG